LSIALLPILVYLLGRYNFGWPVWALYGILFAIFFVVCRLRDLRISRTVWIASASVLAVAILSLSDLQMGKQLYYSVVAYDLNFRTAVTGAFVRTHALPAANPFFSNGTPQPFRYHYFWFMLCSLPVRLSEAVIGYSGFSPRHAVIASSAWAGLALLSTATLFGRFFFEWTEGARRRLILITLLLFGVSGLDIIPVLLQSREIVLPTIDWWNGDQVTGWLDTMLWVPHALGSLIACLAGFLVLWNRKKVRWQEVLAAALAFASAVGLSIYVTLVFAVFAVTWTMRAARIRDRPQFVALSLSGVGAGGLALPFLRELAGQPGSRGSFLVLEIRHFQPAIQFLDATGHLNPFTAGLADLISLPIGYFLELGFFALVAWFFVWKKPANPADSAARLMLVTTIGFCSVVRSNVIQMNDLGARGMLIAQFILVLWGASWLAKMPVKSWLVKATILIGIVSSASELVLLRIYPFLADHEIVEGLEMIDPDDNLGFRDFSARQVYEKLDRILPASAVVQHNASGSQDLMAGLYANHQFAIMDLSTAATFTGDSASPEAMLEPLTQLFEGKRGDTTFVCQQLGIDALVVKDVDPVWDLPDSWVWHTPVLAKADRAIALDCRSPRLDSSPKN
jgi:hypothetical protein